MCVCVCVLFVVFERPILGYDIRIVVDRVTQQWDGHTHYVMVIKIQWKPFWHATQLYHKMTGLGDKNTCER